MTFFDSYSYKKKNIGLAIFTVLLLAVAYKKAFSISIESKDYRDELLAKLELASHADKTIREKQVQIANLNRFLGEENSTVERVQQGFLNFFAQRAQKLEVYQIDEVLNFKHPDFEINTHSIVLKGDYLSALDFIYALEKDFHLAKILNLQFEYKRFSMDEGEDLYTTLLIQNYLR